MGYKESSNLTPWASQARRASRHSERHRRRLERHRRCISVCNSRSYGVRSSGSQRRLHVDSRRHSECLKRAHGGHPQCLTSEDAIFPGRDRDRKDPRRESRIGCIETEPAGLPLQVSVSPRHRFNSDGALGQGVSLAIECRRMNKRIERQRAFPPKIHSPLLGLRLPIPVPLRQDFGGPPPQAERVV
jgi:hypothetical protein